MATTTGFHAEQYAEAYPPGAEDTYWHIARNRILARHIRAACPSRVLDVGCGRGILVEYLVRHGVDCYGVELAEVTVPETLHGRIFAGIAAQNMPAQLRASIDVMVLGDVIEHLEKPVEFLRSLIAAFPVAKTVIITVAARPELWSNYDEHYGHFRRYTLDSLGEIVEQAGLGVKHLSHMFRLLYVPAWLVLRLRGKRATRFDASGARWMHCLLAAAIEAEYLVLPGCIYGTSAICGADTPAQNRAFSFPPKPQH